MKIKIGTRFISDNEPTIVIAEARFNHNMNLDMVKRLIDCVADVKADAVKFQTYSAEILYSSKTQYFQIKNVLNEIKDINDS